MTVDHITYGTFDRITHHPLHMGGKPCIRGLRVTVDMVVGLVKAGKSHEEILEAYPYLEAADIEQSIAYAAWRREERLRTYPARAAWGWGWCIVGYSLLLLLLRLGVPPPGGDFPELEELIFELAAVTVGPVAITCVVAGWVLRRPVK